MTHAIILLLCAASPLVTSPALTAPDNPRVAQAPTSIPIEAGLNSVGRVPEPLPIPSQGAGLPEFPGPSAIGSSGGAMPAAASQPNAGGEGAFWGEGGVDEGSGPTDCGPGGCGGCGGHHGLFGICHRNGRHCDPSTHVRCHALWNCPPGDMYPWAPEPPVLHGNYYFRPYHWTHIARDQALAARWGADPRSPYTSDLMQTIYAEMGIEEETDYEQVPQSPAAKQRPSDFFEAVHCR